jgi:hypothetical protein
VNDSSKEVDLTVDNKEEINEQILENKIAGRFSDCEEE